MLKRYGSIVERIEERFAAIHGVCAGGDLELNRLHSINQGKFRRSDRSRRLPMIVGAPSCRLKLLMRSPSSSAGDLAANEMMNL